jgi:acyl-CoA dehydrogenase family protein 9
MNEESFMKSLFHGVIAESVIFPYPEPSEGEADSINAMLESVRRFFAANVDSAKIDAAHEIPADVLAGLKELGLFGMQIPIEYGGTGMSATGYARVMQEVAALDPSIAVTLGGHQSIGLKGILLFGTEAPGATLPRSRRAPTSSTTAATCSTVRRSGSPTAASPICSRCSRGRPPRRKEPSRASRRSSWSARWG